MKALAYLTPVNEKEAIGALGPDRDKVMVLGGGQDLLARMKDYVAQPDRVVNIKNALDATIAATPDGGLKIGAAVKIADLAEHAQVARLYPALARAAGEVGTPQIRNQGTIGGNVSQDTRCWYYRSGWTCYRAGGNICYADTPTAVNREHAIFGADRCVAVNPSDSAPAFIALDAVMVVRSSRGERVIDAEDYFIGPGTDITRMTVLQPGSLLTAIRLPATWAGAQFYFEKVRDRQVWDFPLVNVASAIVFSGDRIERMRLAVNGVAAHPMRLRRVEDAVRGKPRNEATANLAGELAIEGAQPLQHNGYKIPLMRNLVKRAIRGGDGTWTS